MPETRQSSPENPLIAALSGWTKWFAFEIVMGNLRRVVTIGHEI
jgi:hypothetical protein